jgi:crotonobetainyl-CoA:carnitine CoA-transferase CaiB-like acyl-CoA transferase
MGLATQELTLYMNTGVAPKRSDAGMGHPCIGAPMGVYKTKDGYIVVAMMPLGKVAELVGVSGYEGSDSRNAIDNRDEIKRTLEPGFLSRTTAELIDIFMQADIWAAPVNTFPQVVDDPQVKHNGTIVSFEHPKVPEFRTVGPAARFSRTPCEIRRPPLLSEHAEEILAEMGFSAEEVQRMRADGVIGSPEHNA